jgi:hypothetical protein
MLQAIPRHWYSWRYDLVEGTTHLAEVCVSSWRAAGQITVGQNTFKVSRQGMFRGAFLLESSDGSILARAEKPSVFRRSFDIQHQGRHYILKTGSMFGRRLVLLDGMIEVGSLTARSILSRRAEVNLPEDLPAPVKAFVVWLSVLLWKRASDGGGTT